MREEDIEVEEDVSLKREMLDDKVVSAILLRIITTSIQLLRVISSGWLAMQRW